MPPRRASIAMTVGIPDSIPFFRINFSWKKIYVVK
jgi:hypothetical protein